MGYRVAAHLAPPAVPLDALSGLDPALAVRAWTHADPPLTVCEVWKRGRKDPWPFSDFLNRYHLSEQVVAQAPILAALVQCLRDAGYGVPGVYGELNLGLESSALLNCRVVSFVTDDEDAATFSVAYAGQIVRARFLRGDIDATWEAGRLDVYPLVPSNEDPEEAEEILVKSAAAALGSMPGVQVHSRDRPWCNLLHGMVIDELSRLGLRPILGLGTWDPPEDLGTSLRATRSPDGRMA